MTLQGSRREKGLFRGNLKSDAKSGYISVTIEIQLSKVFVNKCYIRAYIIKAYTMLMWPLV